MCNLYQMISNVDAMRQLFRVTSKLLPNLPVYTEIYPDKDAPVIRDVAGVREITTMRWGFPPPAAGTRGVINVRNLSSPFWRTALLKPQRRCLVPVSAFSEWTARLARTPVESARSGSICRHDHFSHSLVPGARRRRQTASPF